MLRPNRAAAMLLARACGARAPTASLKLNVPLQLAPVTGRTAERRWQAPRGSCFLSSTAGAAGAGSLYITGFSNNGALGLGAGVTRVHTPTLLETDEKVSDVACGRKFTLFVTKVAILSSPKKSWVSACLGAEL